MTAATDPRPLIAHVVFRFDVGGLENGVVNLINHLPERKWRHAVIAVDDIAPAFRARVRRGDVTYVALRKPPGYLLWRYPQLVRLFRALRPDIVHTRNLAALEATVPAWIAGVPARVHGEHGWDVHDIDGASNRFRWIRRLYRPFVQRYVALSEQIESYLAGRVGIAREAIVQIYNGVDTARFHAPAGADARACLPFAGRDLFVVGTVGRMQPVKDQLSLVRAFLRLIGRSEEARRRLRLVIVGDGSVRSQAQRELEEGGAHDLAWLPGSRDDIPELMRSFDLFVLPSLSEGISNTILEAMASALPVVATRVGGNAELVQDGSTGALIGPQDVDGLAAVIERYFENAALARQHGIAGRRLVEQRFSIDSMVAAYGSVYEDLLRPYRSGGVLAQGRH